MKQATNIDALIKKANAGDKRSLEQVLIYIKDYVYNLSLKMLLYPEDAKDATQEILIRIMTQLSTFNYQSKFTTWVYRVTSNYLLNVKGKKSSVFAMPFTEYATLIDAGQSDLASQTLNEGELRLLEEEVKVSCTQGLLLCLKPIDRLVYIIGDILNFKSHEGAEILEISPENFRKKLSRSRTKIRNFLNDKCGLANPNNPCRCAKKIDFLSNQNIISKKYLRFAHLTKRSIELIDKINEVEKSVAIYRSVPTIQAPSVILSNIKTILANV